MIINYGIYIQYYKTLANEWIANVAVKLREKVLLSTYFSSKAILNRQAIKLRTCTLLLHALDRQLYFQTGLSD